MHTAGVIERVVAAFRPQSLWRIDARFAPLGGVNLEFSHANPFANRPASTDVRPGHDFCPPRWPQTRRGGRL